MLSPDSARLSPVNKRTSSFIVQKELQRKNSISPQLQNGSVRRKALSMTVPKNTPRVSLASMLELLTTASEEERVYHYDHYDTTGDFEKDFVYLCRLASINLDVSRRLKIPPLTHAQIHGDTRPPNPPTPPSSSRRGSNKSVGTEKLLPTISVPAKSSINVSNERFGFMKPQVEIITDFMEINNEDAEKGIF